MLSDDDIWNTPDAGGVSASQATSPTAMPDLDGLEQKYNLPSGLLSSVMHQESGGDPLAVSDAGAQGLFQFLPSTAKQYGIDPFDPNQAADGAARMYADLSKKYNGDVPSMLAAYNWGQGNVDRKGLANAPKETRDYINKVMGNMAPKQMMASYEPLAEEFNVAAPKEMSDEEVFGNGSQSNARELSDEEVFGKQDNYSSDPIRNAYQATMNNVAKPINNAVSGVINAVTPSIPQFVKTGAQNFADAISKPEGVGQWVGDKLLDAKNAISGVADNVKDLESYNPDLEKDLSAFGQNAQLAGNIPLIKGARSAIGAATQGAADSLGASSASNAVAKAAAKGIPYDDLATHSAISDSYGAAKAGVKPYYDLMQTIGAGETADASKLKPALDSMIADIQNTPFHEATSELPYLKQQAAKIGEDGTMPLNDMVKLKQNLNNNFNPKRFAQGADTPYVKVGSLVDDSLADAGKRIPEFADAKALADKQWLNTVKSPFEDNKVLQQFWKPEDYYAKKSVESGMLEELPDSTQKRAAKMLSGIKMPEDLNAVRRVLPQDMADSLSQAKIQDVIQNEGAGRLASVGKAITGIPKILVSPLKGSGQVLINAGRAIVPDLTPQGKALIQAAKTPAPSLSTKYAKPFQQLKAQVQQMRDSAGEMQPMNYSKPPAPVLALPAPKPYSVNPRGVVDTGGLQSGIIERNTGATAPPLPPEAPPAPPLALPAPKPYTVNSRGAVSTGIPREGIIERNAGATAPPLSNRPIQTILPPAAAVSAAAKTMPENALVPHMEGVVSELENSNSGHRYFDFSPEGQGGTPNVIGVKSDTPSWFREYNKNNPPISKKYVRDTFEKMKSGQALGPRQKRVADIIRNEGISRLQENEAQRASAVEAAKLNSEDPNHEAAVMHDDVPFAKGGAVKKFAKGGLVKSSIHEGGVLKIGDKYLVQLPSGAKQRVTYHGNLKGKKKRMKLVAVDGREIKPLFDETQILKVIS